MFLFVYGPGCYMVYYVYVCFLIYINMCLINHLKSILTRSNSSLSTKRKLFGRYLRYCNTWQDKIYLSLTMTTMILMCVWKSDTFLLRQLIYQAMSPHTRSNARHFLDKCQVRNAYCNRYDLWRYIKLTRIYNHVRPVCCVMHGEL